MEDARQESLRSQDSCDIDIDTPPNYTAAHLSQNIFDVIGKYYVVHGYTFFGHRCVKLMYTLSMLHTNL